MMLGKHFLKGREEKERVSEMKKEVPPYVMKFLSIVVYKIIVYSKLTYFGRILQILVL